jgi:hypothetical protein
VTLKLNGKSLGEASRVADHVFLKDPTLVEGENRIGAEGSVNGKPVKDSAGSFQGSRYAGSTNRFAPASLVTRMAAVSHSNTFRVRKASVPSSASSVR